MNLSESLSKAIDDTMEACRKERSEFITPDQVLYMIMQQPQFAQAAADVMVDSTEMFATLSSWLMHGERVPDDIEYEIETSVQLETVIDAAASFAASAGNSVVDVPHVVEVMFDLHDSMAANMLNRYFGDVRADFLGSLVDAYSDGVSADDDKRAKWRALVTCLNETYRDHNPLIGREAELERTIQVLCRKEKNNPLHIGEAGVGKTALVYGLTALIEEGRVPERLLGSKIYLMDMGTMVAGAQFRGDFEKRMKQVLDGIAAEGHGIVYIDELHNIVGAGSVGGDGALDASNLLKPYLEGGAVRFIGSTTYEEYNRHLAKNKSLVRRFQQIDIAEPSVEEAVKIVNGLKLSYEQFHGVVYSPGSIDFAVRATARHMSGRCLPDKAIDLIDEAGAYRETHPTRHRRQTVDKTLMGDILSRMCRIDAAALRETDNSRLAMLEADMHRRIFGQDKAVTQVVEAVEMSKAGLADDGKPMASLLFVGPTGVGKTEVARTLAELLGVGLVRFDMSEYAEEHTVSKLIGAPSGYVGYEDGGLLVAAIRNKPNCVLLLDEIEKAHPKIFDILLQVMDYATLTDNRGQKADFRNVILILTSNAGAQYASQANIGFASGVSRGTAMLAQVKRTFKPEFLNRLTQTVVFNDMTRSMAALILDRKLGLLADKLAARKVTAHITDGARSWLLDHGFSAVYGARELDRAIAANLKPLLMREILFGSLAGGGHIAVEADGNKLKLEPWCGE